ncbi:DNA polymerase III subunit beta (plasmid) [Methylobacter sp. YRD-M1]|nr:DNA polymerase III subunit beta [Methylobacter sp. YRD-M1]
MNFSINREQLLPSLSQIVRVIEKRHAMPILVNVLVQCRDQQLVLTGSDLEIQVVSTINLDKIKADGDVTIPARKLLDICRLLPSDSEIRFDMDSEKIKVSSGRGRYVLNTLPADNFPEFSKVDAKACIRLNAGKLKEGLDKTSFCIGNGDVRPYLNGLLLQIRNSKIKLVASDGFRLALYENDIGADAGQEASINIPRKAVGELSRLIDDPEADMELQISGNYIKVLYKNVEFSSKLIDAKYPDFSKAFSQLFLAPLLVDRLLLKEAVMRVSTLTNEKLKGIAFELGNKSLKLSTGNPEFDEAEEEISIDWSDSISIAFNAQYILDAINNIASDTAELIIPSNASACFLKEPGQTVISYLVMPMRL